MLLVLLYESWVRNTNNKMISKNNIYRPLVNGIKFLEEKGIQINTRTGTKTVYFVLGLILGDNLGLHGLLGFTESFVATYYCRFCKLSKNECKNTFVTLPELKRTPKNYEEDIKLNNISQTGIKEECVFHKIRSFHCTQNFSVDEMHDIRESLAHDDIIAILRALTFEKSEFYSFPLSELNNHLLMFDYGPIDCSNRPPPIREEDIKSETKLKMTAAELTTLAKYLGILIKDLVDQSNPYWNLYILLREILDFTLAKKVTKTQIIGFKFVVIRHHILYKELTGKHLKPKFHFITHYSEICQESGPVSHLSSIRAESKHTNLTSSAAVNKCRINICLSLAKKHQLTMNYQIISDQSLMPNFILGPISTIKSNDLHLYDMPNEIKNSKIRVTNWIESHNIKYAPKMVLLLRYENLMPILVEIQTILSIDSIVNNVYFMCKNLLVLKYNEQVCGFEVERSNVITWITL
ncbi:GSCOCG00010541001-RA-CDS [Cotesia congregata]|nr:GSCOCG00010541001-RA-CDS [Cotesia congregata]